MLPTQLKKIRYRRLCRTSILQLGICGLLYLSYSPPVRGAGQNSTLQVNSQTGAIIAPVSAATFAAANNLGGGGTNTGGPISITGVPPVNVQSTGGTNFQISSFVSQSTIFVPLVNSNQIGQTAYFTSAPTNLQECTGIDVDSPTIVIPTNWYELYNNEPFGFIEITRSGGFDGSVTASNYYTGLSTNGPSAGSSIFGWVAGGMHCYGGHLYACIGLLTNGNFGPYPFGVFSNVIVTMGTNGSVQSVQHSGCEPYFVQDFIPTNSSTALMCLYGGFGNAANNIYTIPYTNGNIQWVTNGNIPLNQPFDLEGLEINPNTQQIYTWGFMAGQAGAYTALSGASQVLNSPSLIATVSTNGTLSIVAAPQQTNNVFISSAFGRVQGNCCFQSNDFNSLYGVYQGAANLSYATTNVVGRFSIIAGTNNAQLNSAGLIVVPSVQIGTAYIGGGILANISQEDVTTLNVHSSIEMSPNTFIAFPSYAQESYYFTLGKQVRVYGDDSHYYIDNSLGNQTLYLGWQSPVSSIIIGLGGITNNVKVVNASVVSNQSITYTAGQASFSGNMALTPSLASQAGVTNVIVISSPTGAWKEIPGQSNTITHITLGPTNAGSIQHWDVVQPTATNIILNIDAATGNVLASSNLGANTLISTNPPKFLAASPSDGQILTYNHPSGLWYPSNVPSSGTATITYQGTNNTQGTGSTLNAGANIQASFSGSTETITGLGIGSTYPSATYTNGYTVYSYPYFAPSNTGYFFIGGSSFNDPNSSAYVAQALTNWPDIKQMTLITNCNASGKGLTNGLFNWTNTAGGTVTSCSNLVYSFIQAHPGWQVIGFLEGSVNNNGGPEKDPHTGNNYTLSDYTNDYKLLSTNMQRIGVFVAGTTIVPQATDDIFSTLAFSNYCCFNEFIAQFSGDNSVADWGRIGGGNARDYHFFASNNPPHMDVLEGYVALASLWRESIYHPVPVINYTTAAAFTGIPWIRSYVNGPQICSTNTVFVSRDAYDNLQWTIIVNATNSLTGSNQRALPGITVPYQINVTAPNGQSVAMQPYGTSGPANGQALAWNGTAYVPTTVGGGGFTGNPSQFFSDGTHTNISTGAPLTNTINYAPTINYPITNSNPNGLYRFSSSNEYWFRTNFVNLAAVGTSNMLMLCTNFFPTNAGMMSIRANIAISDTLNRDIVSGPCLFTAILTTAGGTPSVQATFVNSTTIYLPGGNMTPSITATNNGFIIAVWNFGHPSDILNGYADFDVTMVGTNTYIPLNQP